MMADGLEMLMKLIPSLAGKRARHHGVPAEDLEQEMWAYAMEHAERVSKLTEEGNEAALRELLSRAVTNYLRAEERHRRAVRATQLGYDPEDEQFYSLSALRQLIPAWLDSGVTEQPPKRRADSTGIRPGVQADYYEWPAVMLDIQQAMKRIRKHHAKILMRYFAYPQGPGGWTHAEISSALGIDPETCRGRVRAALRAMQAQLGGASPYGRRAA